MMVCGCPDAAPHLRHFEWYGIAPVTLRSPFTRPIPQKGTGRNYSGSRPLRNGEWQAVEFGEPCYNNLQLNHDLRLVTLLCIIS
jgi:hypothetical protein